MFKEFEEFEKLEEKALYNINHHVVSFPKIKSTESDKDLAKEINDAITKILGNSFSKIVID